MNRNLHTHPDERAGSARNQRRHRAGRGRLRADSGADRRLVRRPVHRLEARRSYRAGFFASGGQGMPSPAPHHFAWALESLASCLGLMMIKPAARVRSRRRLFTSAILHVARTEPPP